MPLLGKILYSSSRGRPGLPRTTRRDWQTSSLLLTSPPKFLRTRPSAGERNIHGNPTVGAYPPLASKKTLHVQLVTIWAIKADSHPTNPAVFLPNPQEKKFPPTFQLANPTPYFQFIHEERIRKPIAEKIWVCTELFPATLPGPS